MFPFGNTQKILTCKMFLKQIKDKYTTNVKIKDLHTQQGKLKICRVVCGMKVCTHTHTPYESLYSHRLRVKLLQLQLFRCSIDMALCFNSLPERHCTFSSSCSKGNEVTSHQSTICSTTASLITVLNPSAKTIQACAFWVSSFCSHL